MKYALLTGATGGLGRLVAQAINDRGDYTLFACGTNQEKLQALSLLPRVIPLRVDVLSEDSVRDMAQKVRAHTATLDALLHFVGTGGFIPLSEGDYVPAVEKHMGLNLLGCVRVNHALMDLLPENKGRIIHCSSQMGWMKAQPFSGPYNLSKRALEGYNDSLRRELMFRGIRVIKLQPGSYPTDITSAVEQGYERTLQTTTHYQRVLSVFRPLMASALHPKNDVTKLVRVTMKALTAPRPRISYKVGTSWMTLPLELLPDTLVDFLYRAMLFLVAGGNKQA